MTVSPSRSGSASDAAEGDYVPEQLQLEQPLPNPFADLGTSRCEHESVRGNRCTASGRWDGLSGKVLCDEHANEAA